MPVRRSVKIVKREFYGALDDAARNNYRFKCIDKSAEYIDFDILPAEDVAAALCAGCPLRKLCFEFAETTAQNHGVWGGRVFIPIEATPHRGIPRPVSVDSARLAA